MMLFINLAYLTDFREIHNLRVRQLEFSLGRLVQRRRQKGDPPEKSVLAWLSEKQILHFHFLILCLLGLLQWTHWLNCTRTPSSITKPWSKSWRGVIYFRYLNCNLKPFTISVILCSITIAIGIKTQVVTFWNIKKLLEIWFLIFRSSWDIPRMSECKVYLGNLSYDTGERWDKLFFWNQNFSSANNNCGYLIGLMSVSVTIFLSVNIIILIMTCRWIS